MLFILEMRLSTVLLLGFVHFGLSKPLQRWGKMKIKHAWRDIPRGWELYGEARSDHILNLHIGLAQNRLDELVTSLYEVSDPTHERYVQTHPKTPFATLLALADMAPTCRRKKWTISLPRIQPVSHWSNPGLNPMTLILLLPSIPVQAHGSESICQSPR